MSLSILIPVFNQHIKGLTDALSAQSLSVNMPVEMVLLDDASEENYKAQYQNILTSGNVKIHFNQKNEGREQSRKLLAGFAVYDNLLFLDCDSGIPGDDFLKTYTTHIEQGYHVVSGGRVYDKTAPADCAKRLHWKYGSQREVKSAADDVVKGFMSNNFLIKKDIFNSLPYFKGFTGYGHEDTFWGIWFEEQHIPIKVIDNPVLHLHIEDAAGFIQKSLVAVENLYRLSLQISPEILSRHVKLFRGYRFAKRSGLAPVIVLYEKWFHKSIIKNLHSCNPSLRLFDRMRLAAFIKIAARNGA